ncbi:glycosyl transferase [Cnuibacter physcomitrellae]|uniref:Glycosyl transferase n=1 Tax=Cnuibacter physcomitrellae TaxID=1619308 RepID=A0A1X9LWD1_9MICO|nr:glycosyltransferase family 9 protein [Cnuibacter physcomitrellae]ARJ06350.1 glycosyl transferase [Cnuibacter physcomitrellae]
MTSPRWPDDRPVLLALRTLKLGDLLVAVPAVKGLARAFPAHRIVLAVPGWLEPIVRLVDGVDELLPTPGLDDPLPLAPGEVDIAVNLHGSGPESRTLIDLLQARSSIVHRVPEIDDLVAGDPRMPDWQPELGERDRWVRLLAAYGIPADADDVALLSPAERVDVVGAAVVHVGAFYPSRQWPVERFGVVARALEARGERVVLTGSSGERERALAVAAAAGLPASRVLAGELGLAEFAGVIEDARVVVSADTGAAHLASAYGRPSVVLFGPASPQNWGPPPGPHVVLTDESKRRGDAFALDPDPAILAVTPDDVLAAVGRLLA